LPVSMWIDDLQIQKREKAGASVECELVLVVFADNPDNSDYVKQSE